MSKPIFDLKKIKFSIDPGTYERAVDLYEKKKIKEFSDDDYVGYSAIVQGTQAYEVYVHARSFDLGNCDCYLGQNNKLCKHMVAVAIYAVMDGKPLKEEDKKNETEVSCSGKIGELSKERLKTVKADISGAMRYIKSYNGPSRLWFAYQDSLSEGCARLSAIISELPVSLQTAKLLINLLLRLDKKLCNAVDDSDGTVGGFMMEVVGVIKEYIEIDPVCAESITLLVGKETCFEWGDPLWNLIEE
ncbi:MAG: SWIM zinc finger family protein [Candidatus Magasanikbacteria bacterium]